LEDFLVEIEILSLAKDHENIVGLHACYFFEEKLYVSNFLRNLKNN